MKASQAAISTKDLTVRFGGHVAVDALTCEFYPGSLTAILGPNGAGKTTYFNAISGQVKASKGTVSLFGEDITSLSVSQRARRGLGRAFQLTNLFPSLTTLENVRLAVQAQQRLGFNTTRVWSTLRSAIEMAEWHLNETALLGKKDVVVSALSHGEQRKLEIAILLALDPKVYMFDEPTAGMTLDEVPTILELIQRIRRVPQRTVLLVEHKMDVVQSLADRLVVLHQGKLVADGAPKEVIAMPLVQEVYLGVRRR